MSYLQYERLGYEVCTLCSGFIMSQLPAIFVLCESTLASCTQSKMGTFYTLSDDLILFILFVALP